MPLLLPNDEIFPSNPNDAAICLLFYDSELRSKARKAHNKGRVQSLFLSYLENPPKWENSLRFAFRETMQNYTKENNFESFFQSLQNMDWKTICSTL